MNCHEPLKLTQAIENHILRGEGDFNTLALAVFNKQFQHCLPYQRYCRQLGKTPERLQRWQDIPAVSTEVFREFALCTEAPETARYVFQTSGTTQEAKGKHYYHDMRLYDAAIASSFMTNLGLSKDNKTIFRVLTPSFTEVSTSSLFYMFQKIIEWYGDSRSRFYFKADVMDNAQLAQDLAEDEAANRPVVLLGTAFSWVNFGDYLHEQGLHFRLPRHSKLLETGGLKGRTRSVSRTELYASFEAQLGLALDHCFSEYGMTELSSQCYSRPNSHIFMAPPWMPTRLLNPETNEEVGIGETGLVQFFDLANETAVSAIVTSDLAIRHPEGFELVGRAPKAVLRGCSTAFEG